MKTSRASSILASLSALAIAPSLASAVVTQSSIDTPTDVTHLAIDDDAAPQSLTVSGTSDGTLGDPIELRCYSADRFGTDYVLFAAGTVDAGGTWTLTDDPSSVAGKACTLVAVPDTQTLPPGGTFIGPRLFVAEKGALAVTFGPNAGKVFDYSVIANNHSNQRA